MSDKYKVGPENLDYSILGYHKESIFDTKGDLVTVNFYLNYDGVTYSDLRVKETRVYTRDVVTGLLTRRDMTIQWFDTDGVTVIYTKVTTKHYTAQKGYSLNKRARQNLIDTASMYLLSQVGLVDAKAFWKTLSSDAVKDYVSVGDLGIVTEINASAEVYMTVPIKAALDVILNIIY